jgi:hypothetical protein
MTNGQTSEQLPESSHDARAWRTELRETWFELHGTGLRTNPDGRFSFPGQEAGRVLTAVEGVAQHAAVARWASAGGEFLQDVYKTARLAKDGGLVLDPLGNSGSSQGKRVPYIEIPYADLHRLPAVLRSWLRVGDSHNSNSATSSTVKNESLADSGDETLVVSAGAWTVRLEAGKVVLQGPPLRAAAAGRTSFGRTHAKTFAQALQLTVKHERFPGRRVTAGSSARIPVMARVSAGRLVLTMNKPGRHIREAAERPVDTIHFPYSHVEPILAAVQQCLRLPIDADGNTARQRSTSHKKTRKAATRTAATRQTRSHGKQVSRRGTSVWTVSGGLPTLGRRR